MKIIAKQNNRVLEYIDYRRGRVVDFDRKIVYPESLIFSILARGYWEEYSEPIEFTPPIDMNEMIKKEIKGGRGSGNFGHSGRPGVVGGSGTGGSGSVREGSSPAWLTLSRERRRSRDEKLRIQRQNIINRERKVSRKLNFMIGQKDQALSLLKQMKISQEDIVRLTDLNKVDCNTTIFVNYNEIRCVTKYKNKVNGEEIEIGVTDITIGEKDIHFDLVSFKSSDLNKGHGRQIVSQAEELCKKTKIETISLLADISIGRYAWAKLGFDYVYSEDITKARNGMIKYFTSCKKKGMGKEISTQRMQEITDQIKKCKTANDIANVKIPEFKFTKEQLARNHLFENYEVPSNLKMDLGKAFMLNLDDYRSESPSHGGWDGIKEIKKDSRRKSFFDIVYKGGRGSGNFGHAGRPGQIGGSGLEGNILITSKPSGFEGDKNILSKEGTVVNYDANFLKQEKSLSKRIEKEVVLWEGDRGDLAESAIEEMSIPDSEYGEFRGIITKDKGEIVGVVNYEFDKDKVYIHQIATKKKGYGENLIREVLKKAVENKIGLELFSTREAADYYRKIGLKPTGKVPKGRAGIFGLSYLEAKGWLNVNKSKYEEFEPESGCFADSRRFRRKDKLKEVTFTEMICEKVLNLDNDNKINDFKEITLLEMLTKGGAGSGNFGHAGRPGQIGGSGTGGGGAIGSVRESKYSGSMIGKWAKGKVGIWREVKVIEKKVIVKDKKGIPVIDPATGKHKTKTEYTFLQKNGKPLPKYMEGYSWRPNMVEKYWLELKNPKDASKVKTCGTGLVLGVSINKVQWAIFKSPEGTTSTKVPKDFRKCHIIDRDFKQVYDMNERNRKSKDKDIRERADLAKLIIASGIRVGGQEDKNAASRSLTSKKIGQEVFGASTLLGKHVVIEKGSVYLRFPAKSGERYDYKITDKEVEKMILDKAKKAGKNGNLFNQKSVGGGKSLDYMKTLHPIEPTNKTFRDVVANRVANKAVSDMLKSMPKPPNLTQKEYDRKVLEVGKIVGGVLGHEVSVPIYKTTFDKVKKKTVFVKVENPKTKKMERVKTGKTEIKVNPATSVAHYIDPLEFKLFGEFTYKAKE